MHISYFLYTICISALKTTVYAVLRFITIITFGIKIVNKKLLGINIFTHEKRYTSTGLSKILKLIFKEFKLAKYFKVI